MHAKRELRIIVDFKSSSYRGVDLNSAEATTWTASEWQQLGRSCEQHSIAALSLSCCRLSTIPKLFSSLKYLDVKGFYQALVLVRNSTLC
jgi:hypothetical protein